uniref:Uncharacterized protein n=1 Tax=Oryza glumipatula TaxID=40148 RepID=A0A0D9ZMW2_9ORYZ
MPSGEDLDRHGGEEGSTRSNKSEGKMQSQPKEMESAIIALMEDMELPPPSPSIEDEAVSVPLLSSKTITDHHCRQVQGRIGEEVSFLLLMFDKFETPRSSAIGFGIDRAWRHHLQVPGLVLIGTTPSTIGYRPDCVAANSYARSTGYSLRFDQLENDLMGCGD